MAGQVAIGIYLLVRQSSGGEGSGVLSDGQCVARGVRWCQRQGTEERQWWCERWRWRKVEQSPSSMGCVMGMAVRALSEQRKKLHQVKLFFPIFYFLEEIRGFRIFPHRFQSNIDVYENHMDTHIYLYFRSSENFSPAPSNGNPLVLVHYFQSIPVSGQWP